MRIRTNLVTGAALLALGIAACTTPQTITDDPAVSGGTDTVIPQSEAQPSGGGKASDDTQSSQGEVNPIQAIDIALSRSPGVVVEIEAETTDGRPVWEVVVRGDADDGFEVIIDRVTGEVIATNPHPLSEDKRAEAGITAAEAIQIGFAAVPGELDELELDTENSVLVWELDIYSDEGGRYELKIDATTGDIVQQKRDN